MGAVRWGPPVRLVNLLQSQYGIDTFVETGTFQARTAHWASKHFRQVYTIEGSQELYSQAVEKFGHIRNIQFLCGDTRQELRDLLPRLSEPAIFWLDAHWCGASTYGDSTPCPLLAELAALNEAPDDHFILIDDALLFISPPPLPHDSELWPDLTETVRLLNFSGRERYIAVVEDVIVAVPPDARTLVVNYCRSIKATGPRFHFRQFWRTLIKALLR